MLNDIQITSDYMSRCVVLKRRVGAVTSQRVLKVLFYVNISQCFFVVQNFTANAVPSCARIVHVPLKCICIIVSNVNKWNVYFKRKHCREEIKKRHSFNTFWYLFDRLIVFDKLVEGKKNM
jgi:hypothetical protein